METTSLGTSWGGDLIIYSERRRTLSTVFSDRPTLPLAGSTSVELLLGRLD
jgi:hypothetical protein